MMTRRAYCVARVSDKSQEDAFSIDAQFRQMRACCERLGIEIVEERLEPGTSAFTPDLTKLPVLHQTILDIETGLADALVMHESSRLARNEQLANYLLDRLTAAGASFVNSTMDIDYTTPEGRMFFNNEASMNAYSSRKTSQHSKKGKHEQFLQGLPVGAIPFGYAAQRLPDGGVNRRVPPTPIPEEAELIVRAFEDRALGRSPNEIAREWNAAGFHPRSRRGADRFGPQTVRAILSNPFYQGDVIHHGELRRGQHEPIVTEQEWQAAQHQTRPITRRQFAPLLMQGLATCARCLHGIYPSRPTKGRNYPGHRYSYYREASPDANRDCPDAGLLWPSEAPDQHADELMRSLLLSRDWLEYVEAEARKLPADVATRRSEIEETLHRIQKDYFARRLAEAEYLAMRREYDAELALVPATSHALLHAAAKVESFADLWVDASAETRNDACRTVFDRVEFDMRNRTLEFYPAVEFDPLFQLRQSLHVSDIRPARG